MNKDSTLVVPIIESNIEPYVHPENAVLSRIATATHMHTSLKTMVLPLYQNMLGAMMAS